MTVPAVDLAVHHPASGLSDRVALAVGAGEAHHRDVNHGFAGAIDGLLLDFAKLAPSPVHRQASGIVA